MAEKSGRKKSTDELRMEIARSRERVRRDLRGLHYELDFPAKLRRSFREQTILWITAAAAVGVLIALAPMRKKKIYIDAKSGRKPKEKLLETGFVLGALNIGAKLIKPAIVEFVKNRLTGTAGGSRTKNG
jgi:DNA-dependent RNA polymerase auxiliary subunit epsilon